MLTGFRGPQKFVYLAGAVFLARFAIAMGDPAFALGRSFGWSGFFVVFGIMFLAVAAAALFWWSVLPRLVNPKWLVTSFVVFTFLTSFFINYGFFRAADSDWNLAEGLVTSQIEYFCHSNFQRQMCVDVVNQCPSCVGKIERWKRDQMTEKLKAFRPQYPAQAPRQPANK